MSRSAFAVRFASFVGKTPLQYLIRWRHQKAAGLLRSKDLAIADIALRVGYESEAAFNKSFERYRGEFNLRFDRSRWTVCCRRWFRKFRDLAAAVSSEAAGNRFVAADDGDVQTRDDVGDRNAQGRDRLPSFPMEVIRADEASTA